MILIFFLTIFSIENSFSINIDRINGLGLESLEKTTQKSFLAEEISSISSKSYVLEDRENRISDTFKLNEYWKPRASFWFNIYTQHDLDTLIIHDKSNLELIYDIFNSKSLEFSEVHPYVHHNLKESFKKSRIEEVKKQIAEGSETSGVSDLFKKLEIPFPIKQKKILKEYQENVRAQSGQRSQVYSAILRFYPYQHILPHFAEKFNVPKELIAIPFLESSFNPNAVSKVKATGIWQIMPFIEKKFLPNHPDIPYLKNVIISSLVSFNLLRQNFRILKRWDLSVTAYNSGTRHLLKAIEKLQDNESSLEKIFENYKSPHLGFASQNFYAEFLAISHALFYKELIYPLSGVEHVDGIPPFSVENLHIYIAKCKIQNVREYLNNPSLIGLNTHLSGLRSSSKSIPKGTIIISLENLNEKIFFNVPEDWWYARIPQKWDSGIKNYNCSTK